MSLPAVEFAQRTDPGRDPTKQVNEDACGYRETALGHLAVVCDGMGGHEGGREAAELALRTILEGVAAAPAGSNAAKVLEHAIVEANARVHAMSTSNAARPGSTVVAILLHKDGVEVAHVGDSRAYLIQQGHIHQITKDHSLVQQLVDAGVLTPEQAAKHPDANKISRALGMGPDVEVEVRSQPLAYLAGDVFVLCSDGMSDLVKPEDVLPIAGGGAPPQQAAGQLVDLANARGGHDNVTVQVLRARESSLAVPNAIAPTIAQTQAPQDRTQPGMQAFGAPPGYSGAVGKTIADAPQPQSAPAPMASMRVPSSTTTSDVDPAARRRSNIVLVLGIVLGLCGVGIAAVAIVILERQRHRSSSTPAFVDAATPVEIADAGGPSPPATLAPEEVDAGAPPAASSAIDATDAAAPRLRPPRPHHRER